MRTIALSLVGLLLGLAASAAAAQDRLVTAPYPADTPWKEVTNKSNGTQWIKEWIPSDQDVPAYKDILSAQSFPIQIDPADFLKGLFSQVSNACEGAQVNGPTSSTEAGYPVAYGQIYCGRQQGQTFGVNMFFKALRGDDALYVVQREFRVKASAVGGVERFAPSEAAEAAASMKDRSLASRYLAASVYLCGPKSTDARCAAGR